MAGLGSSLFRPKYPLLHFPSQLLPWFLSVIGSSKKQSLASLKEGAECGPSQSRNLPLQGEQLREGSSRGTLTPAALSARSAAPAVTVLVVAATGTIARYCLVPE